MSVWSGRLEFGRVAKIASVRIHFLFDGCTGERQLVSTMDDMQLEGSDSNKENDDTRVGDPNQENDDMRVSATMCW